MNRPISVLILLAALAAFSVWSSPTASAATCADYSTQQEAQEHADTNDGDGDGVYCEALPCPCSTVKPVDSAPQPSETPKKSYVYSGRITQVVDGDTLKVKIRNKVKTVRVIGIDSPESHKPGVALECGAKEAASNAFKWSFAKPLDRDGDGLYDHGRKGRKVTLRTDNTQTKTDQYGRLLAYVNRGAQDFGRRQVWEGWAKVFVYADNPFKRYATYADDASLADEAMRGVWDLCSGDFHWQQP